MQHKKCRTMEKDVLVLTCVASLKAKNIMLNKNTNCLKSGACLSGGNPIKNVALNNT